MTWTAPNGVRQFRLLPGAFQSEESRAAYRAFLLELEVTGFRPVEKPGITLVEVLDAYLDYADRHYRYPDGRPTSQIHHVRIVCRALRELYGFNLATDFTPLKMKAARLSWIHDGQSRVECNRRISLTKMIFRWAVSEELVPPSVYQAVATVMPLRKGQARETEPIGPVDDSVVEATLPFLNRHIRGLVEFQRLTGCRPGEACMIRRQDIDMSGQIWMYRPVYHKTWRHGKRGECERSHSRPLAA